MVCLILSTLFPVEERPPTFFSFQTWQWDIPICCRQMSLAPKSRKTMQRFYNLMASP